MRKAKRDGQDNSQPPIFGKEKELCWINWIKVLCMFFVYMFHMCEYMRFDDLGLKKFYVPFFVNAFFFTSGYLLFSKQLSCPIVNQSVRGYIHPGGGGYNALKSVINRLIFPTLLFSSFLCFPKKIIRGEAIEFSSFACDTILGGSLWFTCALTVAEVLVILLLSTRVKTIWFYFVASSVLALSSMALVHYNITVMNNVSLPWYYKAGMVSTLWITGGGVLARYEPFFERISRGWLRVPITLLMFYAAYLLSQTADLSVQQGHINMSGFLTIGASIWIVVSFCRLLPDLKLVNFLGRRSLGLYFLSGAIPNTFAAIMVKMGIEMTYGLYIIISVVSFLLACVIVSWMYKFIPFVFDFQKLWTKKGL